MAKKPTVKKVPAKKPAAAAKKKAPAAKAASKPKPRPSPAKSAPKAAKPAAKAPPKAAKPAAKAAPKPAPKAAPKPAPKPAAKSAPKPASKAVPAVVKAAAPVPVVKDEVPVTPDYIEEEIAPPSPPKSLATALHKTPISPLSLTISAQSSAGPAANGNTHPANILVIVTCGGSPVTDLSRDHFTLMEHFDLPGQMAPFSNNITSFRNAGTGAYLLQTKPITGAPWRSGHHLAQILVSSPDDHQGQVAVKLVIR